MSLPARRIAIAFAFALALVLGGCGGRSDGGLSAAARARLAPLVEQVRRAAESRDRPGAQRSLTELQRAVASYEKNGEISPPRATQILAAAARVQASLALVPTTTTTTRTTTTTAPEKRGHGKKGKGNEDPGAEGKD